MKVEALAPLIATGATPGVDCLLISTDGASFLRNSSIEAGVCALRNWDEYELELANVTEQNAALLAAAENASAVTVCEEEEEEVYAENGATIPASQVLVLYGIAALSIMNTFKLVVYWRSMVTGIVEIIKGEVDPLSALDKVPTLKKLKKWYNENFNIKTAGLYSILMVILQEVVEFLVQSINADELARFLHWDSLSMYCNLISTNFMVFGLCMILPERFASVSMIITIDVIM
ncbi:hypothetical protein TeGR_g5453, partial [Tetraparma gracilis]